MQLLAKAMDKDFWLAVQKKDCYKRQREELLALWEELCENKPIPVLKYKEFKLFFTTGNRSVYEKPYFARRRALCTSAMLSLIYPEEEKYFDYLMELIYAICDEYTWCLPAHQGELEPNNNARVDLFASETGFSLSEIYTLLGDRLEPLIKNRIVAEIDRRIVSPYTSVENYGWWENGCTTNWAAVCTGSVASTLMLMRPELAKELIPRFNRCMECYLSGFEDDGMCTEGCGYWHYGFGFFVVFADMLKSFTDGKEDWFKKEKVKTVSTFIQKMFLSEKASVSFSDGGRTLSYLLCVCHYLKDTYPDQVVVYDPKYSYSFDGNGHFCMFLRSFTWLNEDYYYNPDGCEDCAEYYADKSEWLIKRTPCYGFAAKGGHNNEPHNNNDVGTFIFAKGGRQVLMDVGRGVYTRQYFGPERYSILECSSRGHSVPIVDGNLQFFGREAAARDTEFVDGVFSTDISSAYRCEGLEKIKRSFSFTDDTVTLSDEFVYTGEGDIVERIVTLYEPRLDGDRVFVEDVTVKFDPSECSVAINSEMREAGDVCYFIDFKLNRGIRSFRCEIK